MQVVGQTIDPLQARLPALCVDWRFLLPLRPGARLLVLVPDGQDAAEYFGGLSLNVTTWRSDELASATLPPVSGRFDVIASPFGVPSALLDESLLASLLEPAGALLLGFANARGLRRRLERDLPVQLLPYILGRLQPARLRLISVHGAFPGIYKPEYILPLEPQALAFFLQHNFHSRKAAPFVRLFSAPWLARLLAHFLPAYFVVARREV